MTCIRCGKDVTSDEMGMTKKLINRGTEEYRCYECLGKELGLNPAGFPDLADQFRRQGCLLF